jgi:oxygen-independent coproporphyrinogen-3 oxidase
VPTASLFEDHDERLISATLQRAGALAERFASSRIATAYIGGGTPTTLSPELFDRLLGGVEALALDIGASRPEEWTVEANPDSLADEHIDSMLEHGVTRISIGVQSLKPEELRILGRRHAPEAALGAIEKAAASGLAVSADLIAGIPAEPDEVAGTDDIGRLGEYASKILDAGATHLSVYDLTLEDGSPLAARRRELSFPDEDRAWEARLVLESTLGRMGLRRYEVSNYAASGRECLHNLAYWHLDSYIGAGPSAVSTLVLREGRSLRIEEGRSIEGYGPDEALETEIGVRDSMLESIMMAFRTSFGLDEGHFARRFGIDVREVIGESLSTWAERLAPGEPWPGRSESRGLALDSRGLDLLNRFLGDCLSELDSHQFRGKEEA